MSEIKDGAGEAEGARVNAAPLKDTDLNHDLLDGIMGGSITSKAGANPPADPPAGEEVGSTPVASNPSAPGTPPADVVKRGTKPVSSPAVSATPTPQDIPEPPEVKTDPKARVAWTHLKRELKEKETALGTREAALAAKEKELVTLRSEMEVLKSSALPVAEVDTLKKQVAEYEDKLGRADVTATSAFRDRYDRPRQQAFMRGVQILTKTGKSPEDAQKRMIELLETKDKFQELQQKLVEESQPVQGALMQLVMDIDGLEKSRGDAIANWRQSKAALQEEENRMVKSEASKIASQSISSAVESLRQEGSWLFMESDSDDKWNLGVKDRILAVQGILRQNDPSELVKYIADGIASRQYRELYEHEHAEFLKLQDEMNKRIGVRPGVAGAASTPGASTPPASSDRKGVNPTSWLDEHITTPGAPSMV